MYRRHTWIERYAFAVATVAVGALLRQTLTILVGPGLPLYITFYPSVMAAALLAGTGPGLAATVLAAILADIWLLPPSGFGIELLMDAVGLGLFVFMGVAISVVTGQYRRICTRLANLVTERTAELNKANEALLQFNTDLELRVAANTSALRRANETLEQRVAERTSEVKSANMALQQSRQAALNLVDDAIEARKRAEQVSTDLRKERDFTAAVLENTGAMVVVLTREGRISRFNRACEAITDYTSADVLGRVFWEFLVPPEDVAGVNNTWIALLAGRFPNQYENQWLTRNGSRRLIAWSNTAITRPDGTVEHIIATGIDITERKQAEQELRLTATELVRSNKDLEQFAHVASHDLKEPLRMVTGFMSLLKERYGDGAKLDSKALEYIWFATEAAARMQKMIDDLLAYSCAGRTDAVEIIEISAIVDSALENLRAGIEESGAVVTRDPLPTINGDSLGLTQVFQNLLGNAIKFHKPGARPKIHIAANRIVNREPGTGPSDSGDSTTPAIPGWLFAIRDNGIGIAPEYHDKLFAIFHRLHTREEYPGSGIGLAICKKIVEQNGGRIWVESKLGNGSIFCFTVPDIKKEQL